jgi:hypothetical protein
METPPVLPLSAQSGFKWKPCAFHGSLSWIEFEIWSARSGVEIVKDGSQESGHILKLKSGWLILYFFESRKS